MSSTATLHPSAASVRQSCLPRLRAPPVTSATFPAIPRSIRRPALLALELSGTLLKERLDALARVLGPEALREGANLDLDRLIDRRLEAVVHGLDDEARGDRRPRPELPGEGARVVERLSLLGEPI